MANFIKKEAVSLATMARKKPWTFKEMVEHFENRPFEEVKREILEKKKKDK